MCKNNEEFKGCPMCDNKMGFAFGTCGECGWNYLDNTFHFIKVHTDDLPESIKHRLITEHGRKYNKNYKSYSKQDMMFSDYFVRELGKMETDRWDEHLMDLEKY